MYPSTIYLGHNRPQDFYLGVLAHHRELLSYVTIAELGGDDFIAYDHARPLDDQKGIPAKVGMVARLPLIVHWRIPADAREMKTLVHVTAAKYSMVTRVADLTERQLLAYEDVLINTNNVRYAARIISPLDYGMIADGFDSLTTTAPVRSVWRSG